MKKIWLPIVIAACLISNLSNAQEGLQFSGYVDAYVAHYTDSVGEGNFSQFPATSPLSDEFGLNIAQLSASYKLEGLRAAVTLHYGDMMHAFWHPDFNALQEANAGFNVCDKLWIDAGFFRSHLGTEGLFPKDNFSSSMAIPTWFEPTFESGVRFDYVGCDKLTLNVYLLNGYNVFRDNNKKKSVGAYVSYACSDAFVINYSNYFGDDSPSDDSIGHNHLYNNLYFSFEKNRFKLIAGGDYCMSTHSSLEDSTKSGTMMSGLITARYMLCKKMDIYTRGEMFSDPDGFMSGIMVDHAQKLTGLRIMGLTAGLEYKPSDNSYLRLEGRQLVADKDQLIFAGDGKITNTRYELMLNFGVKFE